MGSTTSSAIVGYREEEEERVSAMIYIPTPLDTCFEFHFCHPCRPSYVIELCRLLRQQRLERINKEILPTGSGEAQICKGLREYLNCALASTSRRTATR